MFRNPDAKYCILVVGSMFAERRRRRWPCFGREPSALRVGPAPVNKFRHIHDLYIIILEGPVLVQSGFGVLGMHVCGPVWALLKNLANSYVSKPRCELQHIRGRSHDIVRRPQAETLVAPWERLASVCGRRRGHACKEIHTHTYYMSVLHVYSPFLVPVKSRSKKWTGGRAGVRACGRQKRNTRRARLPTLNMSSNRKNIQNQTMSRPITTSISMPLGNLPLIPPTHSFVQGYKQTNTWSSSKYKKRNLDPLKTNGRAFGNQKTASRRQK